MRPGETTTIRVYSNQTKVTLYVDGVRVAKQSGAREFVFENVALIPEGSTVCARSGKLRDTVSLCRVDVAPAIHTLPGTEEPAESVGNWFDEVAADGDVPLEFIDGFFSINDTLNDIIQNEAAATVITRGIAAVTGMEIKASALAIMGSSRVVGLAGMLGADADKLMRILNNLLNKIPK